MDGVTLDNLVAELQPRVVGRRLGRPRACGRDAVGFELPGRMQLRLEAGRGRAGLYLLERPEAARLEGGEPSGPTRQAVLHLRKQVAGRTLDRLERVPGERTLVLTLGPAVLVLRLSGASPAFTLAVDGVPLCTVGGGPAWPPPPPLPEREWDVVSGGDVAGAIQRADDEGGRVDRAVASVVPTLGPVLAREVDGSADSFHELRRCLASPRPTLIGPGSAESWTDAMLADAAPVVLAPVALRMVAGTLIHPPSWRAAAALFLEARIRGERFGEARRRALEAAAREARRLERLEEGLAADRSGLPDATTLRRHAEALLAAPPGLSAAAGEVEVPDPYHPERRLRVRTDPSLGIAGSADRLFDKARRVERAVERLRARLAQTRSALAAVHAREAALRSAATLADVVGASPKAAGRREPAPDRAGPYHYLTTRGLSILIGRGARENHRLTFSVARPEDYWLHARDVPGGHVILRDPEGRATEADQREAAEVAAYFSAARDEKQVDVHLTRRKHLRPGRGGPGRAQIGQADTLRVSPRDPEGRLRRRDSRGV
jgi:predicted ribosome quality control (RQC) complex YloA/Tae2 family protein